jgi:hypothetical protein
MITLQGILARFSPAGGGPPPPSYLLDTYTGALFAYSAIKLKTGETIATRGSNAALSESNIGFAANVISNSEIETLASGGLATSVNFIDQAGNFGNVIQSTKTLQPNLTNASGSALGFFDTTNDFGGSDGKALYADGTVADFNDVIVSIGFKNIINTITDTYTVKIVSNSSTSLFAISINRSGSNYRVAVNNAETAANIGGITYAKDLALWNILTVSRIGGVLKFYVDGVQVTTSTGFTVDARSSSPNNNVGLFNRIGVPVTRSTKGHIKTIVAYTGSDLSAFDISGFNTKMKEIHGIS